MAMNRPYHSILILGCGYVGERVAQACLDLGMRVIATTHSAARADTLAAQGIEAVCTPSPLALPDAILANADAVLDSIPLIRDAQGVQAGQTAWVPGLARKLTSATWVAYLSATSVYGDANGAWVNENHVCQPSSPRGQHRLLAEQAWLSSGLDAEIFRLAGIYGPERNILERLQAGHYQAVQWQPPHYSSRIHVDDIVRALLAAMQHPKAGRIMNLADDLPLPHADYVCDVANIIGAPQPELLTEREGEARLSAMALEFFRDNKRVSNRLLHRELLSKLRYPDYKSGIRHILASTTPVDNKG